MTPDYDSAAIWILLAALCVATAGIELTGLFRSRAGAAKRDRRSGLVLRLLMVPAILAVVISPALAPAAEIRPPVVGFAVGAVVLAAGEGLRVWARVTLGRYFTYAVETSADQPVIRTGPYRVVRHPSYTGIMLIVIGFGVIWGNWLGLAVGSALTFIGLRYRIKVEDEALVADLGDPYRAYADSHQRLIPYVW